MVLQSSPSSHKFEERESLDFSVFHISEKESTKIVFEEKLRLVNECGKFVDEVTISVEPCALDGGGFEVFQYSNDENLMLRTMSLVTRSLETLSEIRKIKQNDSEKLLRITNLPDVYRVFKVETDVDKRTGSRINTERAKSNRKPFIMEGANVLMMRKLAVSRHYGRFTAITVDNEGVFCEAHYKIEYLTHGEAQVTRVVGSEEMVTVISPHGRLLHHKWSNSQWRLESGLPGVKANPFHTPEETDCDQEEDGEPESTPPVDLPAYWQRKEEVLAELTEYMVKHSCVQDMIGDLMKNILFEKPDDPIDFADNFLSEFIGVSRDADSETEGDEKFASYSSGRKSSTDE